MSGGRSSDAVYPAARALGFAVAVAGAAALVACGAPAAYASAAASAGAQVGDAPPVVKITAPGNGSTHAWNSLVNYHIVVSYRGSSTQYQELPVNKVLLQATYVPDLSALAKGSPSAAPAPAAGLLDIVNSNCLGCHEFKAKAMAPSFAAIAARYPDSPAAIGLLSQRIRVGSTGVWGDDSMPSHPDLTDAQLHDIVLWVLKNAANPGVTYYVGTDGAIRMEATGTPAARAGLILTASYTAPSLNTAQGRAAHGEDTVMLRGK